MTKINQQWRLSPEAEEIEVPDVAQEAVVQEAANKEGEEETEELPRRRGALDIHPHHQNHVVTAIMSMATRLGTAWPLTHAPGKTDVLQSNEALASLTRKNKKEIFNMTSCFLVLAR